MIFQISRDGRILLPPLSFKAHSFLVSRMTDTVAAPERSATLLLYVRLKLVVSGTWMMMELDP